MTRRYTKTPKRKDCPYAEFIIEQPENLNEMNTAATSFIRWSNSKRGKKKLAEVQRRVAKAHAVLWRGWTGDMTAVLNKRVTI